MEPENKPVVNTQLNTVTPLSKLLALGLFIILPFFGFWAGINFNNQEPAHETQSIETNTQTESDEPREPREVSETPMEENVTPTDKDLWERYVHPAGFALMIPYENSVEDSTEKIEVKDIHGHIYKVISYRENLGGLENVDSYIDEMYGPDCGVTLEDEDIKGYGVNTYSIFGDYPGNTSDCRNGKNTKLLYSHKKDLVVTWTGFMDAGNHMYMLETIHISTPAYGE